MNSEVQVHPNLWPFQREGVDFMIHTQRVLLADEMGTGKTAQAVNASYVVGANRILVVCLNSGKWVWKQQIQQWIPPTAAHRPIIVVVEGTASQRMKLLRTSAHFYIMNYDCFRIHKDLISMWPWDVLIFDEAHKLKNRKTQMFRAAKQVAPKVKNLYLLTGTPILNRASEAWTLLHLMAPTKFKGYWKFVQTYCDVYYNGFGYQVIDIINPNDWRVNALRTVLHSYMKRRLKSEVLPQMPPKTVQQMWVELEPDHRKNYTEMEDQMMTLLLTGEKVNAPTVLAQLTRLKQIAVDPQLMVDIDSEKPLEGAKMEALMDIIEGLGGKKVVIFSQFARVIKKLARALLDAKLSCVLVSGELRSHMNYEHVQAFQRPDGPQVLLATIQTGGQSLDFTAASTAVFMDKYWTPKINEQAQDRLHRQNQLEAVTIIEILARDSVEERIELLLHRKEVVFDSVVEGKPHMYEEDYLLGRLIEEYRTLAVTKKKLRSRAC